MNPEFEHPIVIRENAAAGGENMMVDINGNYVSTTSPPMFTASSYLHRVPSLSRQWQMYLKDLVESRRKLSQRVQRKSESIDEFMERFPIAEIP